MAAAAPDDAPEAADTPIEDAPDTPDAAVEVAPPAAEDAPDMTELAPELAMPAGSASVLFRVCKRKKGGLREKERRVLIDGDKCVERGVLVHRSCCHSGQRGRL